MLAVFDVPVRTSAQNLGRVFGVGLPLLLAFETPYCEHCRAMGPTLEELARAYMGRVLIVRVDDVEEGALADKYHVTCVPTLVFWRDSHEVARIEGAANFTAVRNHVEYLLGLGAKPEAVAGPNVPLKSLSQARAAASGAANAESVSGAGVMTVSDASFETRVLQSPLPVLVDFWAPWCGPCRTVSPIVEEIGREFAGRLRVVKVNTDDNPAWAGKLNIMGIPTLIFFKRGHEVDRIVGAASKATLHQRVERLLAL